MKYETYTTLIVIWSIFGFCFWVIVCDSVKRLPQKILLTIIGGPMIWIGYVIYKFFSWLFSE